MEALIECIDIRGHKMLYELDAEGILRNERGNEVTHCKDPCDAERFVADFLGYTVTCFVPGGKR